MIIQFAKKCFSFIKYVFISILVIVFLCVGYRFYLNTAYPIKYDEYVNNFSEVYKVDPMLVYAVIRVESKFNEKAKSSAGAVGLMQIMPSTFDWMNSKKENYKEGNLESPEINIDCGIHLLSVLLQRYNDLDVAISAYNAGMGTVDKWLQDSEISLDGYTLENIPYEETRSYVRRVKESYKMYKRLYKGMII